MSQISGLLLIFKVYGGRENGYIVFYSMLGME